MRVPSWLRPLASRLNPVQKRRVRPRRAFHPRVEGLEDRTTPSATPLPTVGVGSGAVELNGFLYYYGQSDPAHVGLWRTDGTATGTTFVASVDPLDFLTAFNGALYFADIRFGYTVWRSDGTAAGTAPMTDGAGNQVRLAQAAQPEPPAPGPPLFGFSDIAGNLYFNGGRRWQVAGDQLVAGPTWGSSPDSQWAWFTPLFDPSPRTFAGSYYSLDRDGSVYFRKYGGGFDLRNTLFRYDATPSTPVLLHDPNNDSTLSFPGTPPEYTAGSILPLLGVNGRVVFTTMDDTVLSSSGLVSGYGRGLWQTDGTAQGTSQLTNHPVGSGTFATGPTSIFPTSLSGPLAAATATTVFFPAATADWRDVELWATDGTPTGTRLVKDINPGIVIDPFQGTGSNPLDFVAVGDAVYFTADDGVHGRELWKSDGTAAGTVMVADVVPGSGTSDPAGLTAVRGRLYFSADDGIHGRELWTTDGTAAGTVLVQDLNPGAYGSDPRDLRAVGGQLVFDAIAGPGLGPISFWGLDTGLPNQAPVARAAVVGQAVEGAVQFSGSAAADPDGDPLTYSWTFSDGTTSTARDPRHVFPDDGPYTATLTVADPYGLQSTATTLNVNVLNVAPTARITAAAGTGGDQVTVSLSADEPSPADQAAGLTYQVNWGDGVVQTVPAAPGNGAGVILGHTYQTAGIYQIQVSAADQDGAVGPTASSAGIVAGSPGNDAITLTGTDPGFAVSLNGQPAGTVDYTQVEFPNPSFNRILPFLVLGGAGDDMITLSNWELSVESRPRLVLDGQGGSDAYSVSFTYSRDSFPGGSGASVSVADGGSPADSDRLAVNGTAGDDFLYKTAGDIYDSLPARYHVLYSGIESWTLDGGGGNDYIHDPDSTNGTIRGGTGDDTIVLASTTGPITVDGGDDSDTLLVQFGNLLGPVTVTDTGTHGTDTVQVATSGSSAVTVSANQVTQNGQTLTLASPNLVVDVAVPASTPPPQVTDGAILFRGDLLIGGTPGDDSITVNAGGSNGDISVVVNGDPRGRFHPTGRIVAYGYAGNDDIQTAGGVGVPMWLYGGDGNDRLKGGGGNNVLLGGAGDDLLVGGNDRDVLIGGAGADRIVGNAADDILVSGSTAFDGNEAALAAVLAEWASGRSYSQRVANVSGQTTAGADNSTFASRGNGDYFLRVTGLADTTTVYDDGAADVLTGSSGQDWFFANLGGGGVLDRVTDLSAAEFANDLTFILS